MNETDISSKEKYYNHVNFLVDCIEKEYNEYLENDLHDIIFETVDSSEIMIYNGYHMDILQNSNNEPQEWKHLVDESDHWQKVISAMAYDVLRSDVWEEINERDIDY